MSDRSIQERPERPNGNGPAPGGRVYEPYNDATFLSVGFPGMKSTSMDDNVESWPVGPGIADFGTVVTKAVSPNGTGALVINSGGSGAVAGIVVHDHLAAIHQELSEGMVASVMTRGRLWCLTDGPGTGIDYGVPACFNPANGRVAATGTSIPNAMFRSGLRDFYDMMTGGTIRIAEVELHYPFAPAAGP